jgi:anti-sigma factor RsiW
MYLFEAEELERGDEIAMKAHAEACAPCAAYLADVERMKAVFESAPRQEPSANLLAECRASLTDVLDDADAASSRGVFGQWLDVIAPARWLTMHPAAAAVLLLLIGFSAGTYSPLWFSHKVAPASPGATGSADSTPRPISEASIRISAPRMLQVSTLFLTQAMPRHKSKFSSMRSVRCWCTAAFPTIA